MLTIAVGKAINLSVKEEDISTSHPLPSYNSDAPPKIIVKFTRKDVRNVYYASRRKFIRVKGERVAGSRCNRASKQLHLRVSDTFQEEAL